jgi:dTDP-4-dehydrorhamnose 3,5-epimerase
MQKHTVDPATDWSLLGVTDPQTVTEDWMPVEPCPIVGVVVKEIRSVPTGTGVLTEVFRADWGLDRLPVTQVFQRTLDPGSISGWHAHAIATDRLFCAIGRIRMALYDGRKASSSHGVVWTRVFGRDRPLTVIVPPGIWHGVQSVSAEPSCVINVVDHAYAYDRPDHWRLPHDTKEIPYTFPR